MFQEYLQQVTVNVNAINVNFDKNILYSKYYRERTLLKKESYRVDDIVGHIVGMQRYDVIIHCARLVITQPHVAELRAAHHAGRDVGHAHRSASEVVAGGLGEALHGKLGGVVNRPTQVRVVALQTKESLPIIHKFKYIF